LKLLAQNHRILSFPRFALVKPRITVPSSGEGSGRCVVYGAGELLGMADVDEGVARPARLLAEPPREPVSS